MNLIPVWKRFAGFLLSLAVLLGFTLPCLAGGKGGCVVGQLRDPITGEPLAGVTVTVLAADEEFDPSKDYRNQRGTTNDQGIYQVEFPWAEYKESFSLFTMKGAGGMTSTLTLLTDTVQVRFEAPGRAPTQATLKSFALTRTATSDEVWGRKKGIFGAFDRPTKEEVDWGFNPRLFLPTVLLGSDGSVVTQVLEEMCCFEDVSNDPPGFIWNRGMVITFSYRIPPTLSTEHLKIKPVFLAFRFSGDKKLVSFDAKDNGKGGDTKEGDGVYTATVNLQQYTREDWGFALAIVHEKNLLMNDGTFAPGTVISQSTMTFFRPSQKLGPGGFSSGWGLDPEVTEKFFKQGYKVIYAQQLLFEEKTEQKLEEGTTDEQPRGVK